MDKRQLMAMAGWAMSKRAENAAFERLCDAIREVVDLVPDSPELPSMPILRETSFVSREALFQERVQEYGPDELPLVDGPQPGLKIVEVPKCRHKFDLKTQRCLHCGLSYLDVKSRKPECF